MSLQPKRTSLQLYRLKKLLDFLASKEGRGTELISLYIPPGRQISDTVAMLRQEYGTASNIKSDTTRRNVQDALVKVMQRLKLFKEAPESGLVIFCGAIPQDGGPGSEKIETYVIIPPEPIDVYLYRCDSRFHIEYLQEQLKEKEAYGIVVMDASSATIAILKGKRVEVVEEITSGIPGKHRAGGQSARRFERLREMRLIEYYSRVGRHVNEAFLSVPELKGIIIAGPGPTKYELQKGDYLHYSLKDKVVGIIDTAYSDEQGVEEVVEKAPEIIQRVRYVEEKQIVQEFLYHIGHDTGLATYGEVEVRKALDAGVVRTLLLSEDLEILCVTVQCSSCGYVERRSMRSVDVLSFKYGLAKGSCVSCGAQSISAIETEELIEDLAKIAEGQGVNVEVISTETEEGQMLKKSFGGVAAILRFKQG